MGQVGQDRDVVGDRADPVEGQPVRRRLDDGGPVAGQRPSPGGAAWRSGASGVVACASFGLLDAADPGRDRADHPGPDAGRLERGDREERGRRLAVRAGDPDDRELVARVAVPPRGGRRPARCACRPTMSCGSATSGRACSTRAAAAPGGGRRHEVVPVDVEPGRSPRRATRRGRARVVGHAARSGSRPAPAGPIARPSRRAPRRRPSATSRSMSAPRRRGVGRLGRGEEVGAGSPSAHRRASPFGAAHEAPGRVAARVVDALVGPGQARAIARRTSACAGRARTSARPRAARRARRRRPRRRGPSPCSPPGSPAGSRASGAGAARPGGAPASRRGRPSGRSRAGRRGGTG